MAARQTGKDLLPIVKALPSELGLPNDSFGLRQPERRGPALPADDKPLKPNLKPPPPTSDAVAVALAQEHAPDRAPKVVAGGRGRVAEQILQIAF